MDNQPTDNVTRWVMREEQLLDQIGSLQRQLDAKSPQRHMMTVAGAVHQPELAGERLRAKMTIPAELKSALTESVTEELSLGGDASTVIPCVLDTLANEGYAVEFVGYPD